MSERTAAPPRGVLAIANGLSLGSAEAWMEAAQRAHGWTYRRPQVSSDAEALRTLQSMVVCARWLAVHGRSDWALAAACQAVIAGVHSLPLPALQQRLQIAEQGGLPKLLLGASVHDEQERSQAATADFQVMGPIWSTPSKQGILEPLGVAALAQACDGSKPVYAIGGINQPDQVVACADAGAAGVLVLRAARDASQLAELVHAWEQHTSSS